jgi:hypothetical protein
MNALSFGGIVASLCIIACVRRAYSKTDLKINNLVGKLVIYQPSKGPVLAGMVTKQCGEVVLSSLLPENTSELYVDPPEWVREATLEEKRMIVKELGYKRASWTFPIWSYKGHQWNLLLEC